MMEASPARTPRLLSPRLLRAAAAILVAGALAAPPLALHHRTKTNPPEPPPPQIPNWSPPTLRPAMLEIPPGRFRMGSPQNEEGRFNREAQHEVRITHPFLLAETEVTQSQYQAVMGTNPSEHKDCADCPVEQVSWEDAVAYCNKLSEKEGLTPCYKGEQWDRACTGYRLPTEAEWEYAARAGREGEMYVGTKEAKEACRFGNYRDATLKPKQPDIDALPCDDGFEGTSPVATFHANDFHLFDMGGNVYEWVWDWFRNEYEKDKPEDPSGPETGEARVIRGGSWLSGPQGARVAVRDGWRPSARLDSVGFRVSRSSPSSILPSHPLPTAADVPDLAPRSPGGPGVR